MSGTILSTLYHVQSILYTNCKIVLTQSSGLVTIIISILQMRKLSSKRIFHAHHFHFISGSWPAGMTQGPKLNMVAVRTPTIQYVPSTVIRFNVSYIIHTHSLRPV